MQSQRFAGLFLLAAVLLNYPLLSLFSTDGLVAGVPVLYAFLFGSWTIIAVFMALLSEGARGGADEPPD